MHVGAATDPDPARRRGAVPRRRGDLRAQVARDVGVALLPGGHGPDRLSRRAVHGAPRGRRASVRLARLYAVGTGPHGTARAMSRPPHHVPDAGRRGGGRLTATPAHVLLVDSSGYEDLGGASTVLNELISRVDRDRFVPALACSVAGAVARPRARPWHRGLQLPALAPALARATWPRWCSACGRWSGARERRSCTPVRTRRCSTPRWRADDPDPGDLAHPLPPAARGRAERAVARVLAPASPRAHRLHLRGARRRTVPFPESHGRS